MSDVVTANTYHGESGIHVHLSGSGSRYRPLSISNYWSGIRLMFRFMIFGPSANPSPNPVVFIGVCANGKPYGSGNAHAFGYEFGSSFGSVTTYTTAAWAVPVRFCKKVAGSITGPDGLSGHVVIVPRGDIAISSPMFCVEFSKASPNWTWGQQQYYITTLPAVDTETGGGRDYIKTASVVRSLAQGGLMIANELTCSLLSATGGTEAPNEPSNGYMDCLNIDWNIPANYSAMIQDLTLIGV